MGSLYLLRPPFFARAECSPAGVCTTVTLFTCRPCQISHWILRLLCSLPPCLMKGVFAHLPSSTLPFLFFSKLFLGIENWIQDLDIEPSPVLLYSVFWVRLSLVTNILRLGLHFGSSGVLGLQACTAYPTPLLSLSLNHHVFLLH